MESLHSSNGVDVIQWHPENPLAPGRSLSLSSCRSQDEYLSDFNHTKSRRRGSGRSISSFTTDWSTATDPTSNTTRCQEEKKQQKRRFMVFTNVLMKFLERKDRVVFDEAKTVIRDCEQKKKRGEAGYESVTESIRNPLKQVVGGSYWKQARGYLRRQENTTSGEADCTADELEPLSVTEELPSFSQTDLNFLEQSLLAAPPTSPLSTQSRASVEDEKKLRRDRFWMLIRVLMKYLEYKDPRLYMQAKHIIKDCVHRHKSKQRGYENLTSSIQTAIKRVVGITYWRRAESYLSKMLIRRANEEAEMDQLVHNALEGDLNDLDIPPFGDDDPTMQERLQRGSFGNTSTRSLEHTPIHSPIANRQHKKPKRALSLDKAPIYNGSNSTSVSGNRPTNKITSQSQTKRRRIYTGQHYH